MIKNGLYCVFNFCLNMWSYRLCISIWKRTQVETLFTKIKFISIFWGGPSNLFLNLGGVEITVRNICKTKGIIFFLKWPILGGVSLKMLMIEGGFKHTSEKRWTASTCNFLRKQPPARVIVILGFSRQNVK